MFIFIIHSVSIVTLSKIRFALAAKYNTNSRCDKYASISVQCFILFSRQAYLDMNVYVNSKNTQCCLKNRCHYCAHSQAPALVWIFHFYFVASLQCTHKNWPIELWTNNFEMAHENPELSHRKILQPKLTASTCD